MVCLNCVQKFCHIGFVLVVNHLVMYSTKEKEILIGVNVLLRIAFIIPWPILLPRYNMALISHNRLIVDACRVKNEFLLADSTPIS